MEHKMEHNTEQPNDPEVKPAQDKVSKKAYDIYQKEGRKEGHAEQNWLDAEAQLQHAGSDQPEHIDHQPHGPRRSPCS